MGLIQKWLKAEKQAQQTPLYQTIKTEKETILTYVHESEQADFNSRYTFVGVGEDGIPIYRVKK